MLHEVFFALSGHPSPLFDTPQDSTADNRGREAELKSGFPILSPSETNLLATLGRLAQLHRRVRDHARDIAEKHRSTICRAVASSVVQTQLASFQKRILEVEERILTRDPDIVGAYNIVPLASIVGDFSSWHRRMEWMWDIVCFMKIPHDAHAKRRLELRTELSECTGAALINKLRSEIQTGFPDVESTATELCKIAEMAWLRQLAVWLLHGQLPTAGKEAFVIGLNEDAEAHSGAFQLRRDLLPSFVATETATSLLFIGRSLHQVRLHEQKQSYNTYGVGAGEDPQLQQMHLRQLRSLTLPTIPTQFARAISTIRLSISRNVLQHLLPASSITQMLTLLRQFFLLGHRDFAVALVTAADERLKARQQGTPEPLQRNLSSILSGLVVKQGEVAATLLQTWKTISTFDDNDDADEILELARDLVRLKTASASPHSTSTNGRPTSVAQHSHSGAAFNDLLFPIPTALTLEPQSPLDLFLTPEDVHIYTVLHAYLIAIRRAHLHLSDLWKQTPSRRDHPVSWRSLQNATPDGQRKLRIKRERNSKRAVSMRKVWATCGAAVFLLSETAAYFEGQVIQESWDHFRDWIGASSKSPEGTDRARRDGVLSDAADNAERSAKEDDIWTSLKPSSQRPQQRSGGKAQPAQFDMPHDPETLSTAHRAYLASLTCALLLTDIPYTRDLRTFFSHIDSFVAFFVRLQNIHQALDLEQDEDIPDHLTDLAQEEKHVGLELDRARKRLHGDMKSIVARLRVIDEERVGSNEGMSVRGQGDDAFVPLIAQGVDRLLMKLDFGRSRVEDDGIQGW
ncbi:hypothetical protein LTR50_006365 [Elasticomyces elasticus]|nr:hypothetical protein LTR50_006365 [Elasticomyces elasticus]